MDKIAKWFGIFDILLILFFIFAKFVLNLSFELNSLLMSLAIGVTFFVLFVLFFSYIKKRLQKKKADKEESRSTKIYLFGAICSVIMIILAFNYSLYLQALLGNDLFLSMTLDKENFILENGDYLSITAYSSIITNPFCSASCILSLKDLSSGKVLFSEEALIFVSKPLSKEYEILVNESYSGQKLYRIDLGCTSEKKLFCYTSTNKSKHTSKIVSVEHFFNEEQNRPLNDLKVEINSLYRKYDQLSQNLKELNSTISDSTSLNLLGWRNEINSLIFRIEEEDLDSILRLYYEQKPIPLKNLMQKKSIHLAEFNKNYWDTYRSVNSEIYHYNELVDNLQALRENITLLFDLEMDNRSFTELNDFVDVFNSGVASFNSLGNLNEKEDIVDQLISLEEGLNLTHSSDENYKIEKTLNKINSFKLSLNLTISNFSLNIGDPSLICCLSNNCEICLDKDYSSANYPIILLHGHSFNEKVSALGSLETFNSFQDNLDKEEYISAGSLLYLDYDSTSKNVLGKINRPVTIKASYYFDVLSTEQGYSLLETKTDNIDTYSIRLKDIIDNVKYITGKDKVIIIAHSMGGLVARRYVQIFGGDSVDKLILIAVPNHGVDGYVINYCSLLGTKDECDDMKSGSLFLNKLNRGDNPDIPVYNIIGIGCNWESSIGDGVVKNESAYLSDAQNYYIDGICDKFSYFHTTILEREDYPEAYDLVKEILSS